MLVILDFYLFIYLYFFFLTVSVGLGQCTSYVTKDLPYHHLSRLKHKGSLRRAENVLKFLCLLVELYGKMIVTLTYLPHDHHNHHHHREK